MKRLQGARRRKVKKTNKWTRRNWFTSLLMQDNCLSTIKSKGNLEKIKTRAATYLQFKSLTLLLPLKFWKYKSHLVIILGTIGTSKNCLFLLFVISISLPQYKILTWICSISYLRIFQEQELFFSFFPQSITKKSSKILQKWDSLLPRYWSNALCYALVLQKLTTFSKAAIIRRARQFC